MRCKHDVLLLCIYDRVILQSLDYGCIYEYLNNEWIRRVSASDLVQNNTEALLCLLSDHSELIAFNFRHNGVEALEKDGDEQA